jgi:hypothetical protein
MGIVVTLGTVLNLIVVVLLKRQDAWEATHYQEKPEE